jgi:hypothetical protein
MDSTSIIEKKKEKKKLSLSRRTNGSLSRQQVNLALLYPGNEFKISRGACRKMNKSKINNKIEIK